MKHLLSAASVILVLGLPASADTPSSSYTIHTITDISVDSNGLYKFDTEEGLQFPVEMPEGSISEDLLDAETPMQHYHCALQQVSVDRFRIVGCSGVGVPGPLKIK